MEAAYTRSQDAGYDATAYSMAGDADVTVLRRRQFAQAVAGKQPEGEPLVVAYNACVVRSVRAIDREQKEEKTRREKVAAAKAQKYAQEQADLREIQGNMSPRAALEAIARRIDAIRDRGFPDTVEDIENLRKLRLYKAVAKGRLKRRANEARFDETRAKNELEDERRERERAERDAELRAARLERERRVRLEAADAARRANATVAGRMRTLGKGALAALRRPPAPLAPIPDHPPTPEGSPRTQFHVATVGEGGGDRLVRYGAVSNLPQAKEKHFTAKMKATPIHIKRSTMAASDADQNFWRRSFNGGSPRVGYMGKKKPPPPDARATSPLEKQRPMQKKTILAHFHPNRAATRYRPSMALRPIGES